MKKKTVRMRRPRAVSNKLKADVATKRIKFTNFLLPQFKKPNPEAEARLDERQRVLQESLRDRLKARFDTGAPPDREWPDVTEEPTN